MLDPSSYTFSAFAVPVIVVGVLNASFGVATLWRERASAVSATFCAMTATTTLWLVCFGAAYLANDPAVALAWVRIEHVGLVLIPPSVALFAATVTGQAPAKGGAIAAIFLASSAFYFAVVSTDWIVNGVHHYYWGYYPMAGKLMPLFIMFFGGVLLASLRMLHASAKQTHSTVQLRRLNELARALGVAYLASVDFLPVFGATVYPFGYMFIGAFVVFATRAIWRDRLVDITPALAARQIVDTMAEGLLVLDRDGVIRVANEAAANLLGSPGRSLIGKSWADTDANWFEEFRGRLADPADSAPLEVAYRRPDGAAGAAIISTSKLRDRRGEWVGTVCIAHDITERQQAEEKIRYLAFHDALTGASNRAVLIDRLTKSLAQARREGRAVGVIFVDLDGFKQINDTQGHDAGDSVLKRVAGELGTALRDEDTLARVGGDEFVLLLPGIDDPDRATAVAERILRRLNQISETEGGARCISASLGIALFPHDATGPETLLRRADVAMYEAKKRGGNGYQLFASLDQESLGAIDDREWRDQRRAG